MFQRQQTEKETNDRLYIRCHDTVMRMNIPRHGKSIARYSLEDNVLGNQKESEKMMSKDSTEKDV